MIECAKTAVSSIWKNREILNRNFSSSESSLDRKRFRPSNKERCYHTAALSREGWLSIGARMYRL